jgi:hypothetical protein
MEACYGGTDVMERPCAMARGKDINNFWLFITDLLLVINGELGTFALYHQHFMWLPCFCFSCRTSLQ